MLTIILIAIATFIATLIGGFAALRLKDKLHLVLGFSAGAVIAVALLDLLPEAINLGSGYFEISTMTSMVALGFLVYLILDRVIFLHAHESLHEDDHIEHVEAGTQTISARSDRGTLGAGTLSIHSLLDG